MTRNTSDRPDARVDAEDDRVYKQSGAAVVRHKSPSPWAWSNPEAPTTPSIERLKSLVQVALRRKQSPPLFPRSDPQQRQQHVRARIGKYLVDRRRARTPVRAAVVRARARTPIRPSNHFSTASSAKPPSVLSVFRAPVVRPRA